MTVDAAIENEYSEPYHFRIARSCVTGSSGGETMSDIDNEGKDPRFNARRRILRASALALATAGTYGAAPFFGPWKHNHAWSQTGQKKPLVIGLTMDASGQYAASGMDDRLGGILVIKEINAKVVDLGRLIDSIHMYTYTTPSTG